MNGFRVYTSRVWVIRHERGLLWGVLPRQAGWYVIHRRGCMVGDVGPFGTEARAESRAAVIRAADEREAAERQARRQERREGRAGQ